MLPVLDRAQVRELDRIAIEDLGLPGVVLMENAGRAASDGILALLERPAGRRAAVLCGAGNNGGDGYVVARHLADAGLEVLLLETAAPGDLSPDAAVFRRVAVALDLPRVAAPDAGALARALGELESLDLLVDAYLGTGFRGELRPAARELLRATAARVEAQGARVVALDVPSGLDVDTGRADPAALRADYTFTFAADKPAFQRPEAREWSGRVSVLPIGVPRAAYARLAAAT